MANYSEWVNNHIASAVLNGLLLLCAGGLFFASLFLCRRRSDGARRVVTWMKLAFLFACIFYLIDVLYSVLTVLVLRDIVYGNIIVSVPSSLASTLKIIHLASVLTVLSSLGRGLLTARDGQRAKLGRPVAVATYATAVLVAALAIASFGYRMAYVFGNTRSQRQVVNTVLNVNRLNAVALILMFVGSVASLGAAVVVFTKVKTQYPTLKTASIVYIVSSFTFFVSALYEIIYIGLHVPLSRSMASRVTPDDKPYSVILRFIFSTLPAFLSLAAIFNLTRAKGKGLWTVGSVPAGFQHQQQQYQGQPMQGQPQAQFGGFQQQGGYFPQGAAPQGYYYPPQQQQQQQQQQQSVQGMPQQQFAAQPPTHSTSPQPAQ